MRNALRLIITATVVTLTVALWTEQGVADVGADSAKAADALIEQAQAQLERGETQTAIDTLHDAIEADPSSSLAQTRLGGAYLLSQDYSRAIEQFQQAISNDEQNAGAFIGLGLAYLHLKQAGPAKAALSEARRLDPTKRNDIDALLSRIEESAAAPHP